MSELNRKKRMNLCMIRSMKNICALHLTWYARSIRDKVGKYRTERLRQRKLSPPTKCPLDVFWCIKMKLSAGG